MSSHVHQSPYKTALFFTLGCKLNFAETSTIENQLSEQGIRRISKGEQAELCVINTCCVTEVADKKSRQAIRRIIKQHPNAFVVVTGCYAQLNPQKTAIIPGVDLVLGTQQKMNLPDYFKTSNLKNEPAPTVVAPLMDISPQIEESSTMDVSPKIVVSPIQDVQQFAPSCSRGDRTRYFLKVQDGCDYGCSYCTVPMARGRSRNGAITELVKMAEQAIGSGAKEIVLTGINIGDFGKTTNETFFDLLQALEKVKTLIRLRISSVEPNLLTDELLYFIAQSNQIAPHFHIPLQSGSDEVLRLMKRKYDVAFFASKIYKIKQLMPDAFIGVDVITGLRGETESCFEQTERLIQSLPISQLHVFTYSERAGTEALTIEPKVDTETKRERSGRLMTLSKQKWNEFYRSQLGKEKKVLFEQAAKGGVMMGFTENYVRVEMEYNSHLINQITPVQLLEMNTNKTALLAKMLLCKNALFIFA